MGKVVPEAADPETGLTFNGVLLAGKAILVHIQEIPDYFARLKRLKAEVDQYQARGG